MTSASRIHISDDAVTLIFLPRYLFIEYTHTLTIRIGLSLVECAAAKSLRGVSEFLCDVVKLSILITLTHRSFNLL